MHYDKSHRSANRLIGHFSDEQSCSDSPLFDVDAALARLDGDRGLLTELVHIYIEDAPMLLVRISNGMRDANCSDVLHAAHLLHGLAANFGACAVTNPAGRLEAYAIDGRLADAAATIEQLRIEAIRLEQALLEFR
jgi:HPt (histidine-containing phosphotransfer) domain-containing protein